MFIAKRLTDGSTVYTNRLTGKRAILSRTRSGWCAYQEGRMIQHGTRIQAVSRIELAISA